MYLGKSNPRVKLTLRAPYVEMLIMSTPFYLSKHDTVIKLFIFSPSPVIFHITEQHFLKLELDFFLLFLLFRYRSRCICCTPSSNLPSLKTGLPHLPNKPWSKDWVLVLRLGRSEDGTGGWKIAQGQKMGQVLRIYFS